MATITGVTIGAAGAAGGIPVRDGITAADALAILRDMANMVSSMGVSQIQTRRGNEVLHMDGSAPGPGNDRLFVAGTPSSIVPDFTNGLWRLNDLSQQLFGNELRP
jgi:hypothetical protein